MSHRYTKSVGTCYGITEYRYTLISNDKKIGFVSSIKVPVLNWYVLCDLFVVKEYRNKVYGRMLLVTALADAKQCGATRIFVQPGPFELNNGVYTPLQHDQLTIKLRFLINFYKSCGFELVSNGWGTLSIPFLYCGYTLCGISENPSDLMVLHLN